MVLHQPLSRVPENTIKYGVGILLSTFGTFWAVEGLGVFAPDGQSLEWPGAELALIVVLVAWIAVSQVLITTLRRSVSARGGLRGDRVRWIAAFGRFWYDFIIGDDWRIAAGVVSVLAGGAAALVVGVSPEIIAPVVGIAIVLVFAIPLARVAR